LVEVSVPELDIEFVKMPPFNDDIPVAVTVDVLMPSANVCNAVHVLDKDFIKYFSSDSTEVRGVAC
jgi:hypothetical protein